MKILNLTQHKATPDQVAAGVIDLDDVMRATVQNLLTFDELPSLEEVEDRAGELGKVADIECSRIVTRTVMIGGAPYLMSSLEAALSYYDLDAVYAFSMRESVEETQPDGRVVKRNEFKHIGFVGM